MTTRRKFLAGSFAAAMAGLPRVTLGAERTDVVVVGAGLAGLNAALLLQDAGLRVIVLEAAPAVGGRANSIVTPLGTIDPGATTIGPYYARIRDIVKRLGVDLMPPPGRGAMGNYVNGQLVASSDWADSKANVTVGDERAIQPNHLENNLLAQFNPLDGPFDWQQPQHRALDISFYDYLEGNGVSEEALRLIGVTSNLTDMRTCSALAQLREVNRMLWARRDRSESASIYDAGGGARYAYISGGTQRLPDAMAAALDNEVRIHHYVTQIEQTGDAVEVRCLNGERFVASHVVSAVPFSLLKEMYLYPRLEGLQHEAVHSSVYTGTTQVYFAIKKPFWDDIGEPGLFADTLVERVFAQKDAASGDVTWLKCWINGLSAYHVDALPDVLIGSVITKELERIRPALKGKIEYVGHYSWGRNRYIRGNKIVFHAGQLNRYGDSLAQPHGRLHFAGEHTRVAEAGMEAAATSGERAAMEIIEQLA